MTSLKEARETGKLAQFTKEHHRYQRGNATAFNATLAAIAGKSKAVPAALKNRNPDG